MGHEHFPDIYLRRSQDLTDPLRLRYRAISEDTVVA